MLDSSVCVGRSDVIDAARCAQIFENLWKYIVDPKFCFCMNTIKKYLRDYSKKLRAFFCRVVLQLPSSGNRDNK